MGLVEAERLDIIDIRPIDMNEFTRSVRIFAVGGLFGYFGRYYTSENGMLMQYSTKLKNRILILTKNGNKFVISPDDLGIIQDILKSKNILENGIVK